jgi:hypothetical protein
MQLTEEKTPLQPTRISTHVGVGLIACFAFVVLGAAAHVAWQSERVRRHNMAAPGSLGHTQQQRLPGAISTPPMNQFNRDE